MRSLWKIALVLSLVGAGWIYLCTGTPPFGAKLVLKQTPIEAIEFSGFRTNRIITASNQCFEVAKTLQKARQSNVPLLPALGELTIRYTDGTTNRFYLDLPKSNRIFIEDDSGGHAISATDLFGTLRKVGLMEDGRK